MKCVFITHAGPNVGGGHVSRCLALSQALNAFCVESFWIMDNASSNAAEAFGINDAILIDHLFDVDPTCIIDRMPQNTDIVVVDSYIADERLFSALSSSFFRIAIISDSVDRSGIGCADIIIDYSIFSDRKVYRADASAILLLGPRYSLLRKDFWDLRSSDMGYVLLIPGASDVADVGLQAASWWYEGLPELKIVCGPLMPRDNIDKVLNVSACKKNIQVLTAPSDLPLLMANASLVICSASVTMNEALALKKRTAVFVVADNQLGIGEELERMGAIDYLGSWDKVSKEDFVSALDFSPNTNALNGLVDARGAIACAAVIKDMISG